MTEWKICDEKAAVVYCSILSHHMSVGIVEYLKDFSQDSWSSCWEM